MYNFKFDSKGIGYRHKYMNEIFGYEKSLYLFDGLADSIE